MQISTLALILIADVGGIGVTLIITTFIVKGPNRVHAVGWICAIFNIAVFAAPLSIMVLIFLLSYHFIFFLMYENRLNLNFYII